MLCVCLHIKKACKYILMLSPKISAAGCQAAAHSTCGLWPTAIQYCIWITNHFRSIKRRRARPSVWTIPTGCCHQGPLLEQGARCAECGSKTDLEKTQAAFLGGIPPVILDYFLSHMTVLPFYLVFYHIRSTSRQYLVHYTQQKFLWFDHPPLWPLLMRPHMTKTKGVDYNLVPTDIIDGV